ncbi:MAG: M23 family metallopeptidase [Microbacterium sp.]|uniref:murein hydrolase activator EnvC family protein n=1 Tax=Microbacterium sp. TaxID=51671 RepID=UPI001AC7E25A|nr:M23 family metallopeptidase [Microbacterium sp.]MBN9176233.1 M23 family metallopeptidase [Microbacterium sp.]
MSAHFARLARLGILLAVVVSTGVAPPGPGAAAGAAAASAIASGAEDALAGWLWPVTPPRIAAPFVAPAHEYGPGHRGIDLIAPVDTPVRSPAAGVIAFAGSVAGRGVVTIDHGAGLVTTLEPVTAQVAIGNAVAAGEAVGIADAGGHAAQGTIHFGVRRDGRYINPMLLLGAVPRAVLLPCCDG